MAFNVGDFVKSTALTVGSRILNNVISSATSGMPSSLLSSATSTAQSLFNVGASFESISAFSNQKTDSLVNNGSNAFYALAGKDPSRSSAASIKNNRRVNLDSIDKYINVINPTTAIGNKKINVSTIVDGVI